jgi:hypothetical protein
MLWFTASALSLGEGEIKWFLLDAAIFMATMGFSTLRRSGSVGV